jgi:hypothetical protein
MTGRVCHAIEIAPAYVDVAVKRWQDFTGQRAVLDGPLQQPTAPTSRSACGGRNTTQRGVMK